MALFTTIDLCLKTNRWLTFCYKLKLINADLTIINFKVYWFLLLPKPRFLKCCVHLSIKINSFVLRLIDVWIYVFFKIQRLTCTEKGIHMIWGYLLIFGSLIELFCKKECEALSVQSEHRQIVQLFITTNFKITKSEQAQHLGLA